jgi:hypothetical protein
MRLAMSLSNDAKESLKKAVKDLWGRVEPLLKHIPEGIDDALTLRWTAEDVAVEMLEADLAEEDLKENAHALADFGVHKYGKELVDELVSRYTDAAGYTIASRRRARTAAGSAAVDNKLRDMTEAIEDLQMTFKDMRDDMTDISAAFARGTATWSDAEIDSEVEWLLDQARDAIANCGRAMAFDYLLGKFDEECRAVANEWRRLRSAK